MKGESNYYGVNMRAGGVHSECIRTGKRDDLILQPTRRHTDTGAREMLTACFGLIRKKDAEGWELQAPLHFRVSRMDE